MTKPQKAEPSPKKHFGSDRLGIFKLNKKLLSLPELGNPLKTHERGLKLYELKNHLGNVISVVSDRLLSTGPNSNNKVNKFEAETIRYSDYYPFGFEMAGRADNSENYRYGFNGKEKDSPGMGGGGSTYDYGFRIYNPSIAKFLSVDPLTKSYPWYTPYQFAGNKPIWAIDLDGLEEYFMTTYLYTLSGNIVKLSQGVVSSDNDWNGVRYGSSYFFEGKEENGSLAYYRQNEEDEGGMGWVKMYKDNKNYFTALRIHHGIQQQQFNQTVVDGVALSASVIGTIASLGASTPLVVITGMTLGVSSSGLSFAKFTLDILGEHERSSEIPDNIGESLGVAFDEVYKKIDENYDGDMGRTIGGYAEALISLGVRNSFSELGLNDALVSSGLVGAWIANTGKSFEDFDKYLEEFNNIMIEYDRILQAEESEE